MSDFPSVAPPADDAGGPNAKAGLLGLSGYQWLVLAAAWFGWGFDVFDGFLFTYVARLCIPDLLGLSKESAGFDHAITFWTGSLTSLLLVGWGIGGIAFGTLADRFGRTRTMLVTMLMYSIASAGCAFATNIWTLVLFRAIASLGIGGEWAAGASLVAETVPERRRVLAGALLYTASPAGLFLATFVSDLLLRRIDWIARDPGFAWRAVFITALVPAGVTLLIRLKVKEPKVWTAGVHRARLRDLFSGQLARRTIGGVSMSVIALMSWWCCQAFIPRIASLLAEEAGENASRFTTIGSNAFNLGGLAGSLLTIPIAARLGRRPMFLIYFALSAAAIGVAFGLTMSPLAHLYLMFPVGLGVFGVFGSFTFYLPELFPTRLRGTGAGFCYNFGRFFAAFGPFVVGATVTSAKSSAELLQTVGYVAIFPLIGIGLVLSGLVQETRDWTIADQSGERQPT